MPSPHLQQVFLRIFFAVFDRGSGKVEEALGSLGKTAGFRHGEIPSITWGSITAGLTLFFIFLKGD